MKAVVRLLKAQGFLLLAYFAWWLVFDFIGIHGGQLGERISGFAFYALLSLPVTSFVLAYSAISSAAPASYKSFCSLLLAILTAGLGILIFIFSIGYVHLWIGGLH